MTRGVSDVGFPIAIRGCGFCLLTSADADIAYFIILGL